MYQCCGYVTSERIGQVEGRKGPQAFGNPRKSYQLDYIRLEQGEVVILTGYGYYFLNMHSQTWGKLTY